MAIYKGNVKLAGGSISAQFPNWASSTQITASGFTFPNNGYLCISMDGRTHSTNEVYINGICVGRSYAINKYQESCLQVQIPVYKGDVLTYTGSLLLANFFTFRN